MLSPTDERAQAEFEPTIVAFLCNWCSYAGADLAGTQRLTYPANVRVIRVMCSGRVDPGYVLQCLLQGADGVLVSGCHHGDCHYVCGNRIAERRVTVMRRLLEFVGVEPGRVRLTWVSGAEGRRFARVIDDVVRDIKALGPFHGFERRAS
ncbi:MAG: hydrogenase iron-sulfur subunit [Acidobacteria bacterium]|nr:hydrogenase iron-sulfur subunit [Acidobacteriota bacterium]NIM64132.1 hydrogenase iron-sulfur subunit [Acidobacteriota bacterium]NIO59411.1 hydrogenase iron-sulfur subunit [Acidobacteriota bacterium]NIQ30446.1 hydrogenase iron-sulfur subunit [Acidobacteriota bacterium]NIQ85377.1 hydrogenase iron-sulfur subunit [Acidobacteriota bacterium]